jgi:hypothetical protein
MGNIKFVAIEEAADMAVVSGGCAQEPVIPTFRVYKEDPGDCFMVKSVDRSDMLILGYIVADCMERDFGFIKEMKYSGKKLSVEHKDEKKK